MHLTKHHVFGNDFLVRLDDGTGDATCAPGWVRGLCDRRRGVGADGVLWVRPIGDDPGAGGGVGAAAGPLRAAMTLYNADGGEAEVSGNGLACLAQALILRAGRDAAEVLVSGAAGEHRVVVEDSRFADADDTGEGFGRIRSRARVVLGPAAGDDEQTQRARVALSGKKPAPESAGYVSVGNPHVVALLANEKALDAVPLENLGPVIELMLGPVNLEVVAVLARGRVRLRVWERGVGMTAACGSGAAATVWQLHRWGLVSEAVQVEMPGGTAEVIVGTGDTLELRVPVIYVADVQAPEPAVPNGGGSS